MKSWSGRFQFREAAFFWLVVVFVPIAPMRAVNAVADKKEIVGEALDPYISPTNGLGSWIWTTNTFDGQVCQLWRTFEIPAAATVDRKSVV